MADQKTLKTRISLKYDTWANWSNATTVGQGANLVLKKGEVAFCEVPSNATVDGVQNPPHILYKVGDGTKKFSELAWGSAKASDVHTWAKESLDQFNTRVSNLISAALTGDGVTITGYVTETDFNQFKTTIENRIKAVEDRVKAIEDDYTTAEEASTIAQEKADTVLGTNADTAGTATVHGALKSAAAADAKAEQNKTDIATINTKINNLDDTYATDAEVATIKSGLETEIGKKVNQSAYDTKVEALEQADTNLANRVTPLETKVSELETASAGHATKTELNNAVAGLKGTKAAGDTTDETIAGAKKYADDKIALVMNNSSEAIDSVMELAAAMTDNADAIEALTGIAAKKADQTALDATNVRVTNLEKDTHTHTNKAELDKIVSGDKAKWDTAASDINTHKADTDVHVTTADKTKWNAVTEKADQSVLDAHTTNKSNPHGVTAAQVGAYTTAQADEKFATKAGLADGTIVAKEATHAANADKATSADSATRATQDGNGKVIAETYETKTNVAAIATRVENIEKDYLKEADEFIIDCGSSTSVIF